MLIRMYAAGLTVVIAMLFTLTPADAFARSGGFGGRSFAMAQGFRAPAFRQSLGFRSAVFRQSLAFRSRIWRQSLFDRGRYGLGALWARLGLDWAVLTMTPPTISIRTTSLRTLVRTSRQPRSRVPPICPSFIAGVASRRPSVCLLKTVANAR